MAYGKRYRAGFSSKNQTGYINIYQSGYAAAVEDLTLIKDSVKWSYTPLNRENPFIGLKANFAILNNRADFLDLLPLLTAEEREFFVEIEIISPSSFIAFEGYLNSDVAEQAFLNNRPIRLTASSYISKLKDMYSNLIETLEERTFIDIILDCLSLTGSTADVLVNNSLVPTQDAPLLSGKTALNLTGVYTESFWKNNVDRDSAYDVIKKILSTFDSFLYWYNKNWYIERYADAHKSTTNYVKYSIGTSYSENSTAATASFAAPTVTIESQTQEGQSVILRAIAGMREVEIREEHKQYFNLVISDLSNVPDIQNDRPTPWQRRWLKYQDPLITWSKLGEPYRTISNAIERVGVADPPGARHLFTQIRVTVSPDTTISMKWKYASNVQEMSADTWSGDWSDYLFRFSYNIRHEATGKFVEYDDDADQWVLVSETWTSDANQYIEINGTELDPANVSTDLTATIPIGSVAGISGDTDFIITFGPEYVEKKGLFSTDGASKRAYYGDFEITASGDIQDNNLSGVINNNFLNKLSVEMDFSDINNYNLKNGVFRGPSLLTRSTTWADADSSGYTLKKMLMRDKWRFYNETRLEIAGKIRSIARLKPMQPILSSTLSALPYQKKFILSGYTYEPERDRYTLTAIEHDNETITFL